MQSDHDVKRGIDALIGALVVLLESQIALRKKRHQKTADLQRRLALTRAQQIEGELAA